MSGRGSQLCCVFSVARSAWREVEYLLASGRQLVLGPSLATWFACDAVTCCREMDRDQDAIARRRRYVLESSTCLSGDPAVSAPPPPPGCLCLCSVPHWDTLRPGWPVRCRLHGSGGPPGMLLFEQSEAPTAATPSRGGTSSGFSALLRTTATAPGEGSPSPTCVSGASGTDFPVSQSCVCGVGGGDVDGFGVDSVEMV